VPASSRASEAADGADLSVDCLDVLADESDLHVDRLEPLADR